LANIADNTSAQIEPSHVRGAFYSVLDALDVAAPKTVSTKTANYTATAADDGVRFVFNSATAVTLTLPNSLPVAWECSILQLGAGQVTVVVTGGTLTARDNHTKTGIQNAQAHLWVYANAGTAPQVAFSGDTTT
jgi:hypothetical protein